MRCEVVSSVQVSVGTNCVMAQNGREAVEVFETRAFDLIFMDCEMPVMDGYSAVRAIREVEKTRGDGYRTPVIAMTANAMRQDRQKCFDTGMDNFLPKSLHRETLANAVRKYTKKARRARKGLATPTAPSPSHGVADVSDSSALLATSSSRKKSPSRRKKKTPAVVSEEKQ